MQPYQTKPGYLYIPVKRGDGIVAASKPKHTRMFDGMCGGYIDPERWQTPPILSVFNQGETLWLEVFKSEAMLKFAKESSGPTTRYRSSRNYRRSKHFLSIDALQPYLAHLDDNFKTNFYSHKKPMPVMHLGYIDPNIIKNSEDINPEKELSKDVGQITQGTYTIGPGPEDHYPTFGGGGGSCAALGNLTGNLFMGLNGMVTESDQASILIDLNGFSLATVDTICNFGNPTTGHILSVDINLNDFLIIDAVGPGTINFNYIHLKAIDSSQTVIYMPGPLSDYDLYIDRCIFDGNAMSNNLFELNADGDGTTRTYFRKNIITSTLFIAFFITSSNAHLIGNTVLNCGTAFGLNNDVLTVINNAAFDNTICFSQKARSTGNYNFSSDLTAVGGWAAEVGNQNSITSAASLQSTNIANRAFADINFNGPLVSAGQAAGNITPCMRGRISPFPGFSPSIGAADITKMVGMLKYW